MLGVYLLKIWYERNLKNFYSDFFLVFFNLFCLFKFNVKSKWKYYIDNILKLSKIILWDMYFKFILKF